MVKGLKTPPCRKAEVAGGPEAASDFKKKMNRRMKGTPGGSKCYRGPKVLVGGHTGSIGGSPRTQPFYQYYTDSGQNSWLVRWYYTLFWSIKP